MDRIGIPRGFLYYRYGILWKSFFDVLEIPYIVSDNTTAGKKVYVTSDGNSLNFEIKD